MTWEALLKKVFNINLRDYFDQVMNGCFNSNKLSCDGKGDIEFLEICRLEIENYRVLMLF